MADVDVILLFSRSFRLCLRHPGLIGLYLIPGLITLALLMAVLASLGGQGGFLPVPAVGGMQLPTYPISTPEPPTPGAVTRLGGSPLTGGMAWALVGKLGLFLLAGMVLVAVSTILAMAAQILMVDSIERGVPMGALEALGRAPAHFLRLLGAYLMMGLVVVGPVLLVVGVALWALLASLPGSLASGNLVGAFGSILGFIALLIPLFILALVLLVYMAVRLLLVGPISVLERRGPVAALRGAWGLSRGNFWLFFVMVLLFLLATVAVGSIPYAGIVIQMFLVAPAQGVAFTLLYLALRPPATGAVAEALPGAVG